MHEIGKLGPQVGGAQQIPLAWVEFALLGML
jgi:hypothetical protein